MNNISKFNFSRFYVLYNYIPKHPDELELREGDVVNVTDQFDDGWFIGISERTNAVGTFPGNYVKII